MHWPMKFFGTFPAASLASAQRQSAYEVVPQYDIKGSVSQFDENVIRNQKDLGVNFKPFLNLGISRDAASNILGLDLSVLTTDDMPVALADGSGGAMSDAPRACG